MKIAEVVGLSTVRSFNARQEPILRATPTHYARAESNKDQVIAVMAPMDFLKLSSPPDQIEHFIHNAQKLSDYNRYAREGSSSLMPFLRIDVQVGQVISHEGRHRAAAVLNAGGAWMRASLSLEPYSYKTKRVYEPRLARDEANRMTNSEYMMTAEDLPAVLRSQYDPSIKVSTRNWRIENPDNLAKFRR